MVQGRGTIIKLYTNTNGLGLLIYNKKLVWRLQSDMYNRELTN